MAKQANLSDKDIQDLSNKLDTMFKNLSDNMAYIDEEELSETKVTIYPNPTKGVLKVDISGVEKFENAQISLYDLTGKLLQQWAGISQSNTIDLSERTPGMYIMQVAYNGKISSWKIIKE